MRHSEGANIVCISFTEDDVFHLPSKLLCKSLVQRVCVREWFYPCFSDIAVLGSLRLSSEVQLAKDGPDFTRRSYLTLVSARLSASVLNLILEVPISDEFLDLISEHDALLRCMADILVILIILIPIPFETISSQRIKPLVDACLLGGQEDFLIRHS